MPLIFNDTFTTSRAAYTEDAQGTDVADWTTATTIDDELPASVQKMSASEVTLFARRNVDADFFVFTNVRPLTRLGDRGVDGAGALYSVQDVDDMAGRGRYFCIACKRLQVPA